jgi:hypothetical protein
MRVLALLMCLQGCGTSSSSNSCTPMRPDPCADANKCDGATRKCVDPPGCTASSACNGYLCSTNGICQVNCVGSDGKPDDSYCDTGFTCNPSFVCAR